MIRHASAGRSMSAQTSASSWRSQSGAWTADALELIQSDEHAREVQLVDDAGRSAISDLESALQQRCRALLVLNHDFGGLAEQLVAVDLLRLALVALPRLERFPQSDLLEDVRLVERVVGSG